MRVKVKAVRPKVRGAGVSLASLGQWVCVCWRAGHVMCHNRPFEALSVQTEP